MKKINLGTFRVSTKFCMGQTRPNNRSGRKSHTHPFHEIGIVEEGKCCWVFPNSRVVVPQAHAILVPQGVAHREVAINRQYYRVSWLGFAFVDPVDTEAILAWSEQVLPVVSVFPELQQRIQWVHEEMNQGRSGMLARINLLIQEIILLIFRESLPNDGADELTSSKWGESPLNEHQLNTVLAAAHMLESNYQVPISMERLAHHLGWSLPYFSTMFKKYFSVPPVQYLTRVRLKKVRELLETTSKSIQTIAKETGFYDVAYLSRQFRREFGQSPNQYRRQVQPPRRTHEFPDQAPPAKASDHIKHPRKKRTSIQ